MSGYANALGETEGTFLAFDKSNGELATYTHTELEDTSERIGVVREALALDTAPERPFEPTVDRSTKRPKLALNCSYCSHKMECWKEEDVNLEIKSGRQVFFLGKEKAKPRAKPKNAF